jgi:hypothetical protein
MDIEFVSFSPDGSSEVHKDVHKQIGRAIRDGHIQATPCHTGTITVEYSIHGPFKSDVTGNITCSCGKPLSTFTGNADHSSYNIFKA